MTHDLMASLIAELRAEVEEVGRHRSSQQQRTSESSASRLPASASFATSTAVRATRSPSRCAPARRFASRAGFWRSARVRVHRAGSPNQVVQALGMTGRRRHAVTLRKEFKLGDERGVVVTSAAGAARDKGVRRGDLVTDVNGKSDRRSGGVLCRRARRAAQRARASQLLARRPDPYD
jgi:hypothetical protein